MINIHVKLKCADCGGTGIDKTPPIENKPDVKWYTPLECLACGGTGYIEAWLPLSEILELAACAMKESA